ncbi:MAG: HEAT repeat domain-containing protein [Planctomycetota bacterium]|jgi:HEAT repeat protein
MMTRRQWIGFIVFPAAIAGLLAFLFFVANVSVFGGMNPEQAKNNLAGHKDHQVRMKAANHLFELVREGKADLADAAAALTKALEDSSPGVRANALHALAFIKAENAPDAVIKMLGDKDPMPRQVAAFAAGAVKIEAAVPALRTALNDSWEPVRWNVAVALARLGDGSGRGVLHQMLRAPNPRSMKKALGNVLPTGEDPAPEPNRAVYQNAIGALILVGDQTSADALKAFVVSEVDPDLNELVEEAIQAIERRVGKNSGAIG